MHLYRQLKKILGADSVTDQLLSRHANSRDAGFYRLLPQVVVTPRDETEVQRLLQFANAEKTPIVFRAGGTSLSGQAISDSILVRVDQHWRSHEIGEKAETIRLQAGVVGSWANLYLAPHQRMIGPDPGSINAALIAGIVGNNASGITSGTEFDSYHTLDSIRVILPSGFTLDTSQPDAEAKLKYSEPAIYKTLIQIREEILTSPELIALIERKFGIKNTMGYCLNSFLDFQSPAAILAHLMVGSEGTLGFISEVCLKTREVYREKATALLLFPSLETAVANVLPLKACEPAALELLDETALKAIRGIPGVPAHLQETLPMGCAALLVEFQARSVRKLREKTRSAMDLLREQTLLEEPTFQEKAEARDTLWKVRRELGPLHAGRRPSGTSIISEDICFQLKDLAAATRDLKELLNAFDYRDAIVFGHAGDGNLHFKLSIDFDQSGARERYRAFMEQLSDLVAVRYQGSLKAEHGTGRNMAPYLEKEWGKAAVDIMRRIKAVVDPQGIMNPGVIFNDDPLIHLRNIKPIPQVDTRIDACIECGLCEPFCPSHDLTLSPRERISVLREIQQLAEGSHHDQNSAHRIQQEFRYAGVETCARDGLCELACPVDVNTGDMMKAYHASLRNRASRSVALWAARHFRWLTSGLRAVLRIARPISTVLEGQSIRRLSRLVHRISFGLVPSWSQYMPGATSTLMKLENASPDLIYLPSCLSRTLAGSLDEGADDLPAILAEILEKGGLDAAYPESVETLCCGLAFHSKGFPDAAVQAATRVVEHLWEVSEQGRIPIVMDTTPCSRFMQEYDKILSGVIAAKLKQLDIRDIIEFLHDSVLPKLELTKVAGEAVLHPTCSTEGLDLSDKMLAIAEQCAESVVIPNHSACCGFAGDRGLLVPELTDAATILESREIADLKGDAGFYSTSRTCEIGMGQATGQQYRSLLYLVHRALQ